MSEQTPHMPDWLDEAKNRSASGTSPRLYDFAIVSMAIFFILVLVANALLTQIWQGRQQERQQWSAVQNDLKEWTKQIKNSEKRLSTSWATLQNVLLADRDVEIRMQNQIKSVQELHKELTETLGEWSVELSKANSANQVGQVAATNQESQQTTSGTNSPTDPSKPQFQNVSLGQQQIDLAAAPNPATIRLQQLQAELNDLRSIKAQMQPQHPQYTQILDLVRQKELELDSVKNIVQNSQVQVVRNQFFRQADLSTNKPETNSALTANPIAADLQNWSKSVQAKCDKLRKELAAMQKRQSNLVTKSNATVTANDLAIYEFSDHLQKLGEATRTPLKVASPSVRELQPLLGGSTVIGMLVISCAAASIITKRFKSQTLETTRSNSEQAKAKLVQTKTVTANKTEQKPIQKKPQTTVSTKGEPLTIEEITRTLGSMPLGILPLEEIAKGETEIIETEMTDFETMELEAEILTEITKELAAAEVTYDENPKTVSSALNENTALNKNTVSNRNAASSASMGKIRRVCEVVVWTTLACTLMMMLTNGTFGQMFRESPLIAWGRWFVGQ